LDPESSNVWIRNPEILKFINVPIILYTYDLILMIRIPGAGQFAHTFSTWYLSVFDNSGSKHWWIWIIRIHVWIRICIFGTYLQHQFGPFTL